MDSTEVDADLKFSIIPEWLLDSEVSHKAIRIYALIARYADNTTLTAWPARGTLAARAKCTVKSVDRALAELIEAGAISKELRKDETGQRSSVYTLRRIRGGDKNDTRTITNELDPIKSVYGQAFESFWEHYPNKLDKARARKAFAKIPAKTLPKVVKAAEAFANDPNLPPKRFIPYPATWLNGERWEDGPLPERTRRGESKTRADENLARLRELERGR